LFRLSLFTFLIYSSFAVVALYLPLYYQFKGFSNSEIGLIMGMGSLISMFSQPFWGIMSDRYKTVKKVLAAIMICAIVVCVPLFSSDTLVFVVIFMMLLMFFFSSGGPLTESLIVKYSNENNRNYGSIRLWGEVGIGLAALWMGVIMERSGLGILGWIFAGIIAVSLISLYWLPDAKPHATPVTAQSLYQLLTNRPFLLFLGLQLMIAIPHRMNDTFLPIYIMDLGGQESDAGLALMIATISAVPTMVLMRTLLRKYSELMLIAAAAIFYMLRWIFSGLVSDPHMLLVVQAFHMLTFPIVLVASIQFVYRIVPRELTSTGQTLYISLFFGLGGITGSLAGGWIMDHFPSNVLYFTGAALCLGGFIMMLLCFPYFARQKEEFPAADH
jgi:PPP family 3-phenylpropionic acid transporter